MPQANPEPSPLQREGVETGRAAPKAFGPWRRDSPGHERRKGGGESRSGMKICFSVRVRVRVPSSAPFQDELVMAFLSTHAGRNSRECDQIETAFRWRAGRSVLASCCDNDTAACRRDYQLPTFACATGMYWPGVDTSFGTRHETALRGIGTPVMADVSPPPVNRRWRRHIA